MKRISDILGMPVIDAKGNAVGEVQRVVYSRARGKVLGVLLKKGRPARETAAIRFRDIISLSDSVIIVNCRSQVNPENVVEISRAMEEEQDITGHTVLTEEGEEIGIIKDVVINEASGDVQGYLMAGDLLDDLMQGRKILKLDGSVIVGNSAVVVGNGNIACNPSRGGGLKDILKMD